MQTSDSSPPIASWQMPAPLLGLIALSVALILGGLYYSANRVASLRSEIDELETRRDVLLGQVESAQRTLVEVQSRAKQAVDLARERCAPADVACQNVAAATAEVQATAASAARSIEEAMALEPQSEAPLPLGNVAELREQLSGKDRRQVSDAMAIEYHSNPATAPRVISSLAAASLPDREKSAYRVNLYILRTLAKVKGGWAAPPGAEREALIGIANSNQLRKDPTYQVWADQALKNERR